MATEGTSTKPPAAEDWRARIPSGPLDKVPLAQPIIVDYSELASSTPLDGRIRDAFGPDSLGLLLVTNIPGYVKARERLLRLSAAFASQPSETLARYESPATRFNVGWSHGKELMNGKLDTSKGSFYANPLYDDPARELAARFPQHAAAGPDAPEYLAANVWPTAPAGFAAGFKALAALMVQVGALVARQCDRGLGPSSALERLLSESLVHKGRLLHYFPPAAGDASPPASDSSATSTLDNACGWHMDNSLLTALTAPMYLDATGAEVPETAAPLAAAGLYILNRAGALCKVAIPAGALAFQTGEALQLLTAGALCATPHAVRGVAPGAGARVSRNTFAVFLQPNIWEALAPGLSFGAFTKAVFARHYA